MLEIDPDTKNGNIFGGDDTSCFLLLFLLFTYDK